MKQAINCTQIVLGFCIAVITACVSTRQTHAAEQVEGRQEIYIGTLKNLSSDGSLAEMAVEPTKRIVRFKLAQNAEVVSGLSEQHPANPVRGERAKVLKLNELVNQTILISSQTAKAGRSKRDLEVSLVAQVARATPETDEAGRIVNGLAISKPSIAEEFAARLHLCEVAVAYARKNQLGNSPHIVVGQIVYRGRQSARAIAFQSQVMDEGFFVTVWSEPDKEAQIALHGFKPQSVKSRENTPLVNLGMIELVMAPPAESASVAFSLPVGVEAMDMNKDFSMRVRPSLVTAWGTLADTDSPLNISVRKGKNSTYTATGLTPGLMYSLELKAKNAQFTAEFALEAKEKRESVDWEKLSARQGKNTVEIADPAFERLLNDAKSRAKQIEELRRKKPTLIIARLRVDRAAELPIGKMASIFEALPGGRMVGAIEDREKPFYIRAIGYREKRVVLTAEQKALSNDDPMDIGDVLLEKLPPSESASINGRLRWRQSVENPPNLKERVSWCRLDWSEMRNAGWGHEGQNASIDLHLDDDLQFSAKDLLPGEYGYYILNVGGKEIASSYHNFINASRGSNGTFITVLMDWSKLAHIEWIVWQDDKFHISHKKSGQIETEKDWWAVPKVTSSDDRVEFDLHCLVKDGKMQLHSFYAPAYFKDLGKGELDDFLHVTPTAASKSGDIAMIPGHVYLIRRASPAPVVLMRVIDITDLN